MTETDRAAFGLWTTLCDTQGWNQEDQITMLLGYILHEGHLPDFVTVAQGAALHTHDTNRAH